jgi:hypothetical protein
LFFAFSGYLSMNKGRLASGLFVRKYGGVRNRVGEDVEA